MKYMDIKPKSAGVVLVEASRSLNIYIFNTDNQYDVPAPRSLEFEALMQARHANNENPVIAYDGQFAFCLTCIDNLSIV